MFILSAVAARFIERMIAISDKAYPDMRCTGCNVLLFRGWMYGQIKCRSCGHMNENKTLKIQPDIDYNVSDHQKFDLTN
jgi:phage FluMu protein Com